MSPLFWTPRLVVGLVLLTGAGCYSYYPYGSGYPGPYTVPPAGTVTPGAVIPGTVYPQAPTSVYPPGTSYAPGAMIAPPAGTSSSAQAYSGSAPGYESSPSDWQRAQTSGAGSTAAVPPTQNSYPEPATSNPVPNYTDPTEKYDPSATDPSAIEPGGFGDNGGYEPFGAGSSSTTEPRRFEEYAQSPGPILQEADGNPDANVPGAFEVNGQNQIALASATTADDSGFVEPIPAGPGSTGRGPADPAEMELNPYDYDPGKYSWLRGVVDCDPSDKTWNLIYDVTPDFDDRFQGSITLADDPRLSVLRNDDVVLIEGRVDERQTDRRGKPVYRIDQNEEAFLRLVPNK